MEVNLQKVYEIYHKWLYLEHDERVDIVLAAALSHTADPKSSPLWLFLIGRSGDGKSEQIRAILSWKHSKMLSMLTPKTFVNGFPKVKDEIIFLNNSLLLTTDMSPMLTMNRDDKAEVFAQLRDLYDGYINKTFGTGKRCSYSNIFFTWIAGSTPLMDNQIIMNQSLGTRELVFRIPEVNDVTALKAKVRESIKKKEVMREELSRVTSEFLDNRFYQVHEITDDVYNVLSTEAEYLSMMRAEAEVDAFTGELFSDVSAEQPTRVLEQLIKLYHSLMSLDKDYSKERALRVIHQVVHGSSSQKRIKVFEYMVKNKELEFTLSHIASMLKIGKKTAYRELNILWNLGLVNRRIEEVSSFDGKYTGKENYFFSIDQNSFFVIQALKKRDSTLNSFLYDKCVLCDAPSPPFHLDDKGVCEICNSPAIEKNEEPFVKDEGVFDE